MAWRQIASTIADNAGSKHDERKGQYQREYRDERQYGDTLGAAFFNTRAHAIRCDRTIATTAFPFHKVVMYMLSAPQVRQSR
jgi:hypothetical protein